MKKLSSHLSYRKKRGHFSQKSSFVNGRLEVFKYGEHYFSCGLCLSVFSSKKEATMCLHSCAIKALSESGTVKQRSKNDDVHFFCGICQRKYVNEGDASSCFSSCLNQALRNFPEEISLRVRNRRKRLEDYSELLKKNGNRDLISRKRQLVFVPVEENLSFPIPQEEAVEPSPVVEESSGDEQVFVQPPPQEVEKSQPVAKVEENIIELPIPNSTPDQTPPEEEKTESAPVAPVEDPNLLYREEDQKPFFRQDARYACSVCKNKFFTKHEVEDCFFSHPLKPS